MVQEMEKKIEKLLDQYMEDYLEGKVIDKIKNFEHPDRHKVIDILHLELCCHILGLLLCGGREVLRGKLRAA